MQVMEYGSYSSSSSRTPGTSYRQLYLDDSPFTRCATRRSAIGAMCVLWTLVVVLALTTNKIGTDVATQGMTGDDQEDIAGDGDGDAYQSPATTRIPTNNTSNFTISPNAKTILSKLQSGELCPSWPRPVVNRFSQECGYWLTQMSAWNTRVQKHSTIGPSVYSCVDENLCHGLGDRLSGVQGVLSHAMQHDLPLRIHWQGLPRVFEPCMFPDVNWGEDPPAPHGCELDTTLCSRVITFNCEPFRAKPKVFFNLDRACLPNKACKALREEFPTTLNAANIYGCALRSLFEPTRVFRHDMQFPFRMGANVQLQTLEQAAAMMSKYFVIGIHFRLGDNAAFKNPDSKVIDEDHHQYLIPFHCADTVQSYLEGRAVRNPNTPIQASANLTRDDALHDEFTVDGRPVRWFVASDSENLKELAIRLYQDKLFMLDLAPHHIAFAKPHNGEAKSNILAETFAEWYLLGLSDRLILNRYGVGLFQGRISSFPKTSWVYQLKHQFYDAGKCVEKELPLDGTWSVVDKPCKSARTHLPQPHLDGLKSVASSYVFPQVWIKDGVLTKVSG